MYLVCLGHGRGNGLDQLDQPFGVCVGPEGRVFIADHLNRRIMVVDELGSDPLSSRFLAFAIRKASAWTANFAYLCAVNAKFSDLHPNGPEEVHVRMVSTRHAFCLMYMQQLLFPAANGSPSSIPFQLSVFFPHPPNGVQTDRVFLRCFAAVAGWACARKSEERTSAGLVCRIPSNLYILAAAT